MVNVPCCRFNGFAATVRKNGNANTEEEVEVEKREQSIYSDMTKFSQNCSIHVRKQTTFTSAEQTTFLKLKRMKRINGITKRNEQNSHLYLKLCEEKKQSRSYTHTHTNSIELIMRVKEN